MILFLLLQIREDRLFEKLEMGFLPHEKSIVCGKLIEHQFQIIGLLIFEQMVYIFLKRMKSHGYNGIGKPSGDQLPFFGKINAVILVYELNQPVKIIII